LKSVYISVINDLVCDARAHRTCLTLRKSGAEVTLIGRKLRRSPEPEKRNYNLKRFLLPVNKGFLFYKLFNIRLFIYLMTRKQIDILVSCDLDTLPANYLVSILRNCTLVFDSHEYFTELPELQNKRFTRKVWMCIEKFILPRLTYTYTVSNAIADEYTEKYGMKFEVIRNLPLRKQSPEIYPLPGELQKKKKIIYQGAVNLARGIELMAEAVKLMDNVVFIIAGEGDLYEELKCKYEKEIAADQLFFTGRIPLDILAGLTKQADLGISLEEDLGKNYRYALPNKLFDYIQAEIPVLVSDLPEMKKIVENYKIGLIVEVRDPYKIREQLEFMLFDENARIKWKKQLEKAAAELCWENEEHKLQKIFTDAGLTFSS